jgi:hypothetical protein
MCSPYSLRTDVFESFSTVLVESTYQLPVTSTIYYSQAITTLVTQSSSGSGPAADAIGLADGAYWATAGSTIGILTVLMAWVALKPARNQTATTMYCKECGARIKRNSNFCKECGSKQS